MTVAAALARGLATGAAVRDGEVCAVYPSLAAADPAALGLAFADTTGGLDAAGDADVPFTLMSVSKPFVLALACERLGVARAAELLGTRPTGRPYASLEAIDAGRGVTNPMVNGGAIAAASHVPWPELRDGLEGFAGRSLDLDEDTAAAALATNDRNREIAARLERWGVLACPAEEALDRYTRQCCLLVTTRDLARMGARLSATDDAVTRHVLAVLAAAGLYEETARWQAEVGRPAKHGISGGLLAVAPGRGALAAWSPRCDAAQVSTSGAAALRSAGIALRLVHWRRTS